MSINQNDLLVNEDVKKEVVPNVVQKPNTIPTGYVSIYLSSKGKLSAPEVLHFRNYEYKEILELSSIYDETYFIDRLIDCLNRMVYENFDCGDFTESELNEVLMNIHLNFWGKDIKLPYYDIDVDKEKGSNTELKSALVDLSKINTKNIREDFKEPINLKLDNDVFKFKLPRIKDVVKAKKEIKLKFREEEKNFTNIKSIMEFNERAINDDKMDMIRAIDPIQQEEYYKFQEKKIQSLIYSLQKETLIGLNNTIATVDYEKQQIFTNSNIGYVLDAFEDISGNIEYGLDPVYEVTEIDKDLKEPQIKLRRLEFRPLSFVPKKESNKSKKVDIQFG